MKSDILFLNDNTIQKGSSILIKRGRPRKTETCFSDFVYKACIVLHRNGYKKFTTQQVVDYLNHQIGIECDYEQVRSALKYLVQKGLIKKPGKKSIFWELKIKKIYPKPIQNKIKVLPRCKECKYFYLRLFNAIQYGIFPDEFLHYHGDRYEREYLIEGKKIPREGWCAKKKICVSANYVAQCIYFEPNGHKALTEFPPEIREEPLQTLIRMFPSNHYNTRILFNWLFSS